MTYRENAGPEIASEMPKERRMTNGQKVWALFAGWAAMVLLGAWVFDFCGSTMRVALLVVGGVMTLIFVVHMGLVAESKS